MTVGPIRRNLRTKFVVNSLARSVLVDIMPPAMKKLVPVVLLALGACAAPPGSGDDRPIARVAAGGQSSSQQMSKLKGQNVADAPISDTPGSKTPEIDSTRRFEYADITVELGDPTGMRAL